MAIEVFVYINILKYFNCGTPAILITVNQWYKNLNMYAVKLNFCDVVLVILGKMSYY